MSSDTDSEQFTQNRTKSESPNMKQRDNMIHYDSVKQQPALLIHVNAFGFYEIRRL